MVDITWKQEVKRKTLHITTGIVSILLGLYLRELWGLDAVVQILFFGLILSLFVDWLRTERKIRLLKTGMIERPRERHGPHAVTYALLASILALNFYDFGAAAAAISAFFFGDSMAAIIGRKFGTIRFGYKSLQGSLTLAVISFAVGLLFVAPFVSAVVALAAMVSEAWVEQLDDALVIIVIAGFAGHIATIV
ncbi:hypothetical protein HY642_04710 [Candidatus Woesearchaeota archaeon]|nr:hypothetical protein [Candidatus Woesearchaeota archaeon]